MSAVYVHGWAGACAAGASLEAALEAMKAPPVPPAPLWLGHGALAAAYPYRAMPDFAPMPWAERRRRLAEAALAGRTGGTHSALLVASSSLDIGRVEVDGRFSADTLVPAEELAAAIGWRGPVLGVDSACTSAFQALRLARDLLRADAALQEACVLGLELRSRYVGAGFAAMQLTHPWPEPGGLVLGEGAAALWLARPQERWRIAGLAHVVDSAHPAGTSPAALREAVEAACAEAGIGAASVRRVKVHAAGHAPGDAEEAAVLAALLPQQAERIHFKPWLGHTQGASGALEVALLLSMPARGTDAGPPVRHTLVVGIGFGGAHAALVLEDAHAHA